MRSLFLKVILPVLATFLILLSCMFFILYKRKMSKAKASSLELYKASPSSFYNSNQFMRISYEELLDATTCFSDYNLIGVGSYGYVYKGALVKVNSVVAVKVFNLQQRGASKSFLSECNALRNIRHRNLLKIITSCSSVDYEGNDFKALVFEYMPNGSLEEWLHPKAVGQNESRNLNFLQRLNIAIDVASAIDYLHHDCQPTILHCDLKPSNVLLDENMTAHVADFGLAKIFSATSYKSPKSQESSLALEGSIGYIAPEYGICGKVSMKGDVYSYGILLLEMFTKKRPTDCNFQNGRTLRDFAKMMLQDTNEAINMPKHRGAKLQECLVSAIRLGVTCSAECPSKRMDMREVIIELRRIREHLESVKVDIGRQIQ